MPATDVLGRVGIPTATQPDLFFGYDDMADLDSFLARPVLIASYTWAGTDAIGASLANFNPHSLWLTNAAVARKLNDFYRISFDLTVRTSISTSATSFGILQHQWLTHGYAVPSAMTEADSSTADNVNTCMQGRFTHELDAAESGDVELTIPWMSPDPFHVLGTTLSMGRVVVYVRQPLGNSVNMSEIMPTTVRVWAYASNVRLDVPMERHSGKASAAYVRKLADRKRQAGAKGGVEQAADALRAGFGAVKSVPFIGQFAAVGETVAGAVGAIANFFGFTKERFVSPLTQSRLMTLSAQYPTDGVDSSRILALTQKASVSIDPRITGGDGVDEMSYAFLSAYGATRLTYFTWTTAQAVGTVLTTISVCPTANKVETANRFYSALGFVGRHFQYWHGSMLYRVRVGFSAQHRGKLQIIYFPNLVLTPFTEDPTNISGNIIWEVEAGEPLDFTINWAVAKNFLRLIPVSATATLPDTSITASCNGAFQIRVQSLLTAPDNAATVYGEVYATPAPDIQYYLPADSSGFVIESAILPSSCRNLIGHAGADDATYLPSVAFGDLVGSVRALVQRSTLYSKCSFTPKSAFTDPVGDSGRGNPVNFGYFVPDVVFPVMDSGPLPWLPISAIPGGTSPNFTMGATACVNTPLATLSQMYASKRGSTRWKMTIPQNQTTIGTTQSPLYVVIARGIYTGLQAAATFAGSWNADRAHAGGAVSSLYGGGSGGCEIFDVNAMHGAEWVIPYQTPSRFVNPHYYPTIASSQTDLPGFWITVSLFLSVATCGQFAVDYPWWNSGLLFVAGGDDISFTNFRRVPICAEL
jgi:hypothetical protein